MRRDTILNGQFGIEYECCYERRRFDPSQYCGSGSFFEHKGDGSLRTSGKCDNTREIVTRHPAHYENFDKIMEKFKEITDLTEYNDSCGLHFHIGLHREKNPHVWGTVGVLAHYVANKERWTKLAGRKPANYCKDSEEHLDQIINQSKQKDFVINGFTDLMRNERYRTINWTNIRDVKQGGANSKHTIEFRLGSAGLLHRPDDFRELFFEAKDVVDKTYRCEIKQIQTTKYLFECRGPEAVAVTPVKGNTFHLYY